MPPVTQAPSSATSGVASRKVDWTLAYVLIAAVGVVALLGLVTTPVAVLLGDSEYAIPATLHGISAGIYLIVATVCAYMAYLMYTGRLEAFRDLRILAGLQAFFSLITIMFGNWIYIFYRAKTPTSPRSYFLENSPAIHEIFFEFKEFVALFTLPLALSAAFVLWREKDGLKDQTRLRQAVAVILVLAWAALLLAFGLGAAITKIRSV